MSASYGRVLVVERDLATKQALEAALMREGLQATWARTAVEVEAAVRAQRPCLAILNPRLAPEDGWQVLRRLRRYELPVIVATPRADPTIQRLALALGADDCVVVTNGATEVATRARFVLQRCAPASAPATAFGQVALAPEVGGARVEGRLVRLTRSEYALLAALVEAQGRVVSREQLVVRARAGARALPMARSVDAYVRSLRRKLGDDARQPRLLLAVRGFGYRLAGEPRPSDPSLAQAAFEALPEPTLVVDAERRVRLLNRAAEALVGRPAGAVVDHVTCGELLRCQVEAEDERSCPALEALAGDGPRQAEVTLCPGQTPQRIEETVIRLPSASGYLVMQLRRAGQAIP